MYIFTVHFSDGLEDLNLGLGTVTPNGMGLLTDFMNQVKSCAGTEGMISASGLQFQEQIYTFAGCRSGWVANISTVHIE
ncbi:MAG: hypothetical protein V1798_01540 [Pseudomonadota bacterium]